MSDASMSGISNPSADRSTPPAAPPPPAAATTRGRCRWWCGWHMPTAAVGASCWVLGAGDAVTAATAVDNDDGVAAAAPRRASCWPLCVEGLCMWRLWYVSGTAHAHSIGVQVLCNTTVQAGPSHLVTASAGVCCAAASVLCRVLQRPDSIVMV